MTNKVIAQKFKLLAALLEIHEQDIFKIRSYQKAVRIIEKHPIEFSKMEHADIFMIPGVGKAIGNKSVELLEKGHFEVLDKWLADTPPGIVEMTSIKGLGPKKITAIWHELGIETLGELLYACEENRLMLYKGFGEKTQASIRESILFYLDHQGQYLYAQVEPIATALDQEIKAGLEGAKVVMVGAFRRQMPVIDRLQWVTNADAEAVLALMQKLGLNRTPDQEPLTSAASDNSVAGNNTDTSDHFEIIRFQTSSGLVLHIIIAAEMQLNNTIFRFNASADFYAAFLSAYPAIATQKEAYQSEAQLFENLSLAYIPPYLREDTRWIAAAATGNLPKVIEPRDVKGVIHAHSRYSDGAGTLAEMAMGAKALGYEYLVISDHSQTAVYAQGLKLPQILEQHKEIDALNKSLAPFKIFKSIESDILRNGELDYPPSVLDKFDLVIASVHSVLKMNKQEATERILKAVTNKYTHILGHMTGRLLLSRQGYPLDLEPILEACRNNNVVIELNANPRRLDMDWQNIHLAVAKNLLISIDPDAHSINGIEDIRYGVLAAQKAGLTAAQNLSSFSLEEMEAYIDKVKNKTN